MQCRLRVCNFIAPNRVLATGKLIAKYLVESGSQQCTRSLVESLRIVFIHSRVTTAQQKRVLKAIQPYVPTIRGDPRKLLRRPRASPIVELSNGPYIYIGHAERQQMI